MSEEKNSPKISVIIPMYNVEDYVGECLDSLLAQTFQDFEVIVVDDCSTDNSREVVKDYLPKFDGKLRLIESEENSGGCAVPRNIGMTYASGKYLFFLDSDDLIIKNAFAELYSLAEYFQADVVQCEKYYASDTPRLKGALLTLKSFMRDDFVDRPTFETTNITRRIKNLHDRKYTWTAWSELLRREFMIENKIDFPVVKNIEDQIFTIYCLSCAKKFLLVPNVVNIYRYRPGSILHNGVGVQSHVRKWISSFITGFDCCDKFLQSLKFYQDHPDIRYLALDAIAQEVFRDLFRVYKKFDAVLFDEILREEFAKSSATPAVASFLFNMSIRYSMQIGTYLVNKEK